MAKWPSLKHPQGNHMIGIAKIAKGGNLSRFKATGACVSTEHQDLISWRAKTGAIPRPDLQGDVAGLQRGFTVYELPSGELAAAGTFG
jgi:hypothetical protein